MKYLIFRTDRIGDFLITLPLIKSIKRNNTNSEIIVVTSPKNQKFVKNNKLVDDIFVLKSNKFFDKLSLFLELRKCSYEAIIVSDKKNRSLIISLFLKAKKKIFNVSKNLPKKILRIFYKFVFLDNDNHNNLSMKEVIEKNCFSLNLKLINEDYNFFSKNHFKEYFQIGHDLELKESKYVVFHYDEKWELSNYSKLFKKAKDLSNIDVDKDNLMNFLTKLSEKLSAKIFVTTGNIDTYIISSLKTISKKINNSLYELCAPKKNIYMIINQDFYSLSHLISKSNLFISCHGAFTHIASCYNVKILDIIEEEKKIHYSKITSHMKNYKTLYRKDASKLLEEIISSS